MQTEIISKQRHDFLRIIGRKKNCVSLHSTDILPFGTLDRYVFFFGNIPLTSYRPKLTSNNRSNFHGRCINYFVANSKENHYFSKVFSLNSVIFPNPKSTNSFVLKLLIKCIWTYLMSKMVVLRLWMQFQLYWISVNDVVVEE